MNKTLEKCNEPLNLGWLRQFGARSAAEVIAKALLSLDASERSDAIKQWETGGAFQALPEEWRSDIHWLVYHYVGDPENWSWMHGIDLRPM